MPCPQGEALHHVQGHLLHASTFFFTANQCVSLARRCLIIGGCILWVPLQKLWSKTALMGNHQDERPLWWETTLIDWYILMHRRDQCVCVCVCIYAISRCTFLYLLYIYLYHTCVLKSEFGHVWLLTTLVYLLKLLYENSCMVGGRMA